MPEKINKPDVSLKNKILKTINKSLLSSELTGINLTMLKLDDHVRKTLKRIEKTALERDLENDLIRSFSCNHLNDLRREDIKYSNLKKRATSRHQVKQHLHRSYTTEDIQDIYMPKVLEAYKLKLAIEKEKVYSDNATPVQYTYNNNNNNNIQSSLTSFMATGASSIVNKFDLDDRKSYSIASPPDVCVKSPMSPSYRTNPNSLFQEIMQDRLNDFDHKIARQIISSTKKTVPRQIKRPQSEEEMETSCSDSEALSTDQDQDDSLNMSTSSADDLNINDEDMRLFENNNNTNSIDSGSNPTNKNLIFQESFSNNKTTQPKKSCQFNQTTTTTTTTTTTDSSLQNPGSLISDFYISNMNYAMRYSVEYVQQVAKDLRSRRERQDSMNFTNQTMTTRRNLSNNSKTQASAHSSPDTTTRTKINRSSSVDRLYAVRREHIRYSNGADEYFGAKNISFTTDDIQDIYMPSAIDNYKRKIAVELERRRRAAELGMADNNNFIIHSPCLDLDIQNYVRQESVVLDDLDIFIIKKAKSSVESDRLLRDTVEKNCVKLFQPDVHLRPFSMSIDRQDVYKGISVSNKRGNVVDEMNNNKSVVVVRRESTLYDESVNLEKANVVNVEVNAGYGFVSKTIADVRSRDNEVVPSETSESESMDSLDNVDVVERARVAVTAAESSDEMDTVCVGRITIRQSIEVVRAKDSIEKSDLDFVKPQDPLKYGTDKSEKVLLDRARLNYEYQVGDINSSKNIMITNTPRTILGTDQARVNIEQAVLDLKQKVDVTSPPRTSIGTDQAKVNLEQAILGLRKSVTVTNPPKVNIGTDQAKISLEQAISSLRSTASSKNPPRTYIGTDQAGITFEQSTLDVDAHADVLCPPRVNIGTDQAKISLEQAKLSLRSTSSSKNPPKTFIGSGITFEQSTLDVEVDVTYPPKTICGTDLEKSISDVDSPHTSVINPLKTGIFTDQAKINLEQAKSSLRSIANSKNPPKTYIGGINFEQSSVDVDKHFDVTYQHKKINNSEQTSVDLEQTITEIDSSNVSVTNSRKTSVNSVYSINEIRTDQVTDLTRPKIPRPPPIEEMESNYPINYLNQVEQASELNPIPTVSSVLTFSSAHHMVNSDIEQFPKILVSDEKNEIEIESLIESSDSFNQSTDGVIIANGYGLRDESVQILNAPEVTSEIHSILETQTIVNFINFECNLLRNYYFLCIYLYFILFVRHRQTKFQRYTIHHTHLSL